MAMMSWEMGVMMNWQKQRENPAPLSVFAHFFSLAENHQSPQRRAIILGFSMPNFLE